MVAQLQVTDTLHEWRESAKYWNKHSSTIHSMFGPLTRALIEDAGIKTGHLVLDVAGGAGEPSLTIAGVVGPTGSVMCTDAVEEMKFKLTPTKRERNSNHEANYCRNSSNPCRRCNRA